MIDGSWTHDALFSGYGWTWTNSRGIANSEICMIDESWTHDALFSGYGWTWTNSREVTQLLGARNQQRRISQLHSELDGVHASSIDMLGVDGAEE
ncbi:hypothetical protein DY000_02009519 [Brassica cretica]|uniref:Uncharacterized protein n=1 Tax=Brassica cretica TaxID=69181 RepID=A0ABQ7BUP7_BRACR|nr:hypothetical protein DY000_02009519 [Brassica cretica]